MEKVKPHSIARFTFSVKTEFGTPVAAPFWQ